MKIRHPRRRLGAHVIGIIAFLFKKVYTEIMSEMLGEMSIKDFLPAGVCSDMNTTSEGKQTLHFTRRSPVSNREFYVAAVMKRGGYTDQIDQDEGMRRKVVFTPSLTVDETQWLEKFDQFILRTSPRAAETPFVHIIHQRWLLKNADELIAAIGELQPPTSLTEEPLEEMGVEKLFTRQELGRLSVIKSSLGSDEKTLENKFLEFARWLIEHGRLSG